MKLSMIDMMKKVDIVEKHLTDELSKKIYEMRLEYFTKRDKDEWRQNILSLDLQWQLPEIDDMYRINDEIDNIIIFGCGADGKYTLKLLQHSNYRYNNILFCDNDSSKWGKELEGIKVISTHDLLKNYRNSIVIVGSSKYKVKIYEQLLLKHYPRERIMYPNISVMKGKILNQYFDYFEPNESEIFVDGGCLNGKTAFEFTQWASKGYDYIYSFEANARAIVDCEETFKQYKLKGEIINKGMWSKKDILNFKLSLTSDGSKIQNTGEEKIDVTSLDNVLNGKKVTFIKLDIEGAELEALIGSEKTIKNWRPRLAISIYHKLEDIVEIPAILLEMQPDYRFAIRQYDSRGSETVLYAY